MTEDKGQNNEEVVAIETVEVSEKFAKAGKKSKKHVEEVKAEEERKARAAENKLAELEVKPKGEKPVTRPVLERRGKKYQAAYKDIDRTKLYSLAEAIALAVKTNPAKSTPVSASTQDKLIKTFVPPSFSLTVTVKKYVLQFSLLKMSAKKQKPLVLTSLKTQSSSNNSKREPSTSIFSFPLQPTCQNLVNLPVS